MSTGRLTRVAVCGLGRMGRPITGRLAPGGLVTSVRNRNPAAVKEVAAATCACAAFTRPEASRDTDVVVTMLTHGSAVLEVLGEKHGVLAGLRPGVLVNCSTIGAAYASQAAATCHDATVEFLSGTVSGSTAIADRGSLGLMVGGDTEVLGRIRPVVEYFATTIVPVGLTGVGAPAKVAVNGPMHSRVLPETMVAAEGGQRSPAQPCSTSSRLGSCRAPSWTTSGRRSPIPLAPPWRSTWPPPPRTSISRWRPLLGRLPVSIVDRPATSPRGAA